MVWARGEWANGETSASPTCEVVLDAAVDSDRRPLPHCLISVAQRHPLAPDLTLQHHVPHTWGHVL